MVINPQVICGDQKSTNSHFLSVVYLQLIYLTLGFYIYVCVCARVQFICLLRKTFSRYACVRDTSDYC
jgi:hypothetical protein